MLEKKKQDVSNTGQDEITEKALSLNRFYFTFGFRASM